MSDEDAPRPVYENTDRVIEIGDLGASVQVGKGPHKVVGIRAETDNGCIVGWFVHLMSASSGHVHIAHSSAEIYWVEPVWDAKIELNSRDVSYLHSQGDKGGLSSIEIKVLQYLEDVS